MLGQRHRRWPNSKTTLDLCLVFVRYDGARRLSHRTTEQGDRATVRRSEGKERKSERTKERRNDGARRRNDGARRRNERARQKYERATERRSEAKERRSEVYMSSFCRSVAWLLFFFYKKPFQTVRRSETEAQKYDGTRRQSEANERGERTTERRYDGARRRSDGTTERGDGATMRYYFSFVIKNPTIWMA